MKRLILAAAVAMVATCAQAKTADELRVYINPGHGSWTGGDRPMAVMGHERYTATGTDTTSFFESNTNLRKGFGVLDKLRAMGLKYDATLNQTGERHQIGAARDMSNNIVMSHVKCGPYCETNLTTNQINSRINSILNGRTEAECTEAEQAEIKKWRDQIAITSLYNRNLSEISAEVDANNFDMFISIHSNAHSLDVDWSNTNHALIIYRGYDKPVDETGVSLEFQNACRDMGAKCWPYHLANTHESWTSYSTTNMNLRGDINFYGGSITTNGHKGYLGALRHGVPGFLIEGYFHTYAPAALRHMNMDVNYVEGFNYAYGIADYFGLDKGNTGVIYGIVRDQHERFTDPKYQPHLGTADAYKPLNNAQVVLFDAEGKEVARYTTDGNYNGAFVFDNVAPGKYSVKVTADEYKEAVPVTFDVAAGAVTYPEVYLENVAYEPPTVTYDQYPDPLKDSGYEAPESYTFEQKIADKEIAELDGLTVRRFINYDKRIYVLAVDAKKQPTLLVLDAETLDVIAKPSIAGCEGTDSPLYDIAVTADGVLIGTNLELCQLAASNVNAGETRGDNTIYYWKNDAAGVPTGDPLTWFTSQLTGNWYRATMGYTMAYNGTFDEGQMVIGGVSKGGTNFGFNLYNVLGGNKATEEIRSRADVSKYMSTSLLGENITTLYSPVKDDCFIANSPRRFMQQIVIGQVNNNSGDATKTQHWRDVSVPTDILPASAAGTSFFKYNGVTYMVAPDMDADGACTGVRMIDITPGLDKGVSVSAEGTALEGAVAGNVAAAGRVIPTVNAAGTITDVAVELYLLRGNKVSRFGYIVPKVVARKEFAYGLSRGEKDNNVYTLTYTLTGEVESAELVLSPVDDPATEDVRPLADAAKGVNTVQIDAADLDNGVEYNWSVRVNGKPTNAAGEYFADNNGNQAVRGSVVAFTDPEQDAFGYTLIAHGKNLGIDVYDPAGEKVQTAMHKGHALFQTGTTNVSNPMNGDQRDGMAVLGCFGDGACGLVAVNPLDAGEEPFGLYAGDKQGAGHYMYNGVNVGGGISGLAFMGTGEDTKLYTFSEDHEGKNGSGATENSIVRYDIGSAWQIETAPTVVGFKSLLANTNVCLTAYGNGLFASQVRGAGNNTASVPGFAYIVDGQSAPVFNSHTIEGMTNCNGGFAITVDGATAAVGETGRIAIYDVTWNEGVPAFTFKYDITTPTTNWSTMRFDYAGNLHVYGRGVNGYHAYAMADAAPVVTTPAKAEFTLKGSSAVDNIEVENVTDAPVRYYNLNGIEMKADNLTPGIYVKVQGKKAVKVVVK